MSSTTSKKLDCIKNFRLFLLKQIADLSIKQLNEIPQGFNNNIIWNLGHLVAAQQNICYAKAGLGIEIDDRYIKPYFPGTEPERLVEEDEAATIKNLLTGSIDTLKLDYTQNRFVNYSPSLAIQKVYGIEVTNIDEAIDYLLYHDGYHSGCVRSLMSLVL